MIGKEYEVEKILGVRERNGKWEYLLKWVGYEESESTWEPEEMLSCKKLLIEFKNSQRKLLKAEREKAKAAENDQTVSAEDAEEIKTNQISNRQLSKVLNGSDSRNPTLITGRTTRRRNSTLPDPNPSKKTRLSISVSAAGNSSAPKKKRKTIGIQCDLRSVIIRTDPKFKNGRTINKKLPSLPADANVEAFIRGKTELLGEDMFLIDMYVGIQLMFYSLLKRSFSILFIFFPLHRREVDVPILMKVDDVKRKFPEAVDEFYREFALQQLGKSKCKVI